MFQIHNTLTGIIEEFQPFEGAKVRMYACGPTVWNYAHLGNFRTFVFDDILRRYLKFKGYDVTHVMNLTDVDDRIFTAAAHLNIAPDDLTKRFIKAFWKDLESLNCERPEIAPLASEHIAEMIDLIENLLAKGYAYKSENSVYYRIASFPEYGKLSNLNSDELAGACVRVETDKYNKENACDFVLWKSVSAEQIYGWDSPFGRGRPSWHVKCAAMAMKYLGATVDIHTGGRDLQFPHHENEIALSEGATGKPFVRYWLHGEFLRINNEKMSEALNNVYTLRDVTKCGFDPLAVRYLLLSVPFDKQLCFTPENLQGAQSTINRLRDFWKRLSEECLSEGGCPVFQGKAKEFLAAFEGAMDNNLNTSVALAALHNIIREVNIALSNKTLLCEDRHVILGAIEKFDAVFGIFGRQNNELLSTEIEKLIEERKKVRRDRNFARSDEIRDLLRRQGIVLEDCPDGVKWKRTKI